MEPFTVLLLGLTALYLTKTDVNADCSLPTTVSALKVIDHFGSKTILTDSEEIIKGRSSQSVNLYCTKGFLYTGGNGYGQRSLEGPLITLTCNSNGYFYYNNNDMVQRISCTTSQESNLYESVTAMPDCADMTLVVGSNFAEFGSTKYVAMCYDLLGQHLKYAAYTAYPPKTRVIDQTHVGQLNSLGVDVKVDFREDLFKEIGAEAVNEAMRNDKQFQTMIGAETFEYDNLIQDVAFGHILEEYKSMLNIFWLRPLRSGNWRNLLNALKIASMKTNYDVRVGVSGSLSMPVYQNCNETRTLSIALSSGNTIAVPAIIWAHVRALEPSNNSTDEFVAIGHNSPFLTNNGRAGLCNSICDEITWLKSSLFAKLQQYPTYGFVQCCRLSDVAHKLENFPTSAEIPPPPPASKINQKSAENVTELDTLSPDDF